MKIVSYEDHNGAKLGAVKGEGVVDLSRRFPSLSDKAIELIEQWRDLSGEAQTVVAPSAPDVALALGIRCFVNGERRQNSNTENLVFNVDDQIAHLSEAMTLEPGDLIFTGTPGGVGGAMRPPKFLKAGDKVRVEIDRIGTIEAVMRPEGE